MKEEWRKEQRKKRGEKERSGEKSRKEIGVAMHLQIQDRIYGKKV